MSSIKHLGSGSYGAIESAKEPIHYEKKEITKFGKVYRKLTDGLERIKNVITGLGYRTDTQVRRSDRKMRAVQFKELSLLMRLNKEVDGLAAKVNANLTLLSNQQRKELINRADEIIVKAAKKEYPKDFKLSISKLINNLKAESKLLKSGIEWVDVSSFGLKGIKQKSLTEAVSQKKQEKVATKPGEFRRPIGIKPEIDKTLKDLISYSLATTSAKERSSFKIRDFLEKKQIEDLERIKEMDLTTMEITAIIDHVELVLDVLKKGYEKSSWAPTYKENENTQRLKDLVKELKKKFKPSSGADFSLPGLDNLNKQIMKVQKREKLLSFKESVKGRKASGKTEEAPEVGVRPKRKEQRRLKEAGDIPVKDRVAIGYEQRKKTAAGKFMNDLQSLILQLFIKPPKGKKKFNLELKDEKFKGGKFKNVNELLASLKEALKSENFSVKNAKNYLSILNIIEDEFANQGLKVMSLNDFNKYDEMFRVLREDAEKLK